MAKKLAKSELLGEIKQQRTKLVQLLEAIPNRQLTEKGMNSANWSIKDVLTHLIDWESRGNDWYEQGVAGVTPELPGEGFKWNQIRELNDSIFKRHRRKSVKRVLEEFEEVHQRTLANIAKTSDKELTTIGHYDWTGKSWTLSDYFRANTASHFRWARNKIRKWLKEINE